MNDKAREKLSILQDLIKQKEIIEKKIEAILAPEKVVALPPDFSINNEVFSIIKESGDNGIATPKILHALQKKFPDYGIDRKRVASSLAYLKNSKKQIELVDRGIYKLYLDVPGGVV